jgi:phage terminase small subunit
VPDVAKASPESIKRFVTALDFAMDVVNDPDQPLDARVRLAIAAMPFQHPKLEATGAGKKEERQKKAEVAATGRFAPAAPPKLVVNND